MVVASVKLPPSFTASPVLVKPLEKVRGDSYVPDISILDTLVILPLLSTSI